MAKVEKRRMTAQTNLARLDLEKVGVEITNEYMISQNVKNLVKARDLGTLDFCVMY